MMLLLLGQDGMSIPSDAGVLLPAAALPAGRLPHQHISMLPHAVPLVHGHVRLPAHGLGLGRRPREVIPPNLDVVVGELAELVVVHAEQLGLFGGAEVQPGDVVDGEGEDERHGEGPARGGDDVGELDVELAPVVVDPAALDDARVDPVQADDVGRAEEGVGHQAQHAGDAVLGEDVHGVVDVEPVFDCWSMGSARRTLGGREWRGRGRGRGSIITFGAVIADDARDDAQNDGAPRCAVSRGWGGGDEAGDGTRAPANHRPFPREPPIQDRPSRGGKHGGQVRVPAGLHGAQIGAEGRTAVEAQPSKPEEGRAQDDQTDVVGAEVGHHLLLPSTEDQGVGEGGQARADLDGASASVVHDAVLEAPAVDVPGPAGDGAVDERGPEEQEDHHGEHAAAFGDGAGGDGGGGGAELHLVEGVEEFGDQGRARAGGAQGVHQAEMREVADEAAGALGGEGEGVAPEVPLEGDDGEGGHADPNHRQRRFPPGQPRVQEAQSRDHDHDHGRGHDDVGLVSRRKPLVEILDGYTPSFSVSLLFLLLFWIDLKVCRWPGPAAMRAP